MVGDLCAIGLPILLLVGALFIYGATQGGRQRELGDAYWIRPQSYQEEQNALRRHMQGMENVMARTLRELREGPVHIKFKSYDSDKAPLYTMGRPNPRAFAQSQSWIRPPAAELKCGVCGTIIENNEGLGCSGCHTPHHHACWDYNGQCAVFGCQCDIPEDLGQQLPTHERRLLTKPTLGEPYLA